MKLSAAILAVALTSQPSTQPSKNPGPEILGPVLRDVHRCLVPWEERLCRERGYVRVNLNIEYAPSKLVVDLVEQPGHPTNLKTRDAEEAKACVRNVVAPRLVGEKRSFKVSMPQIPKCTGDAEQGDG